MNGELEPHCLPGFDLSDRFVTSFFLLEMPEGNQARGVGGEPYASK
jgi:hypothetical protein